MVKVRIYVEGGGRGKLKSDCREGFHRFFEKAGLARHMPSVVACGSRNDTLKRFRTAVCSVRPEELPLLLVDSEAPVSSNGKPWDHLLSRDNWQRPEGAEDKQAHLMVQCMESWFLADVPALRRFFGDRFKAPTEQANIEMIPKQDVLKRLNNASRNSQKGKYNKGRHSFDILKQIDPGKVTANSQYANRLVETLRKHLIPT